MGCLPAAGADVPAARLIVKPLLCVTDRDATVCTMNFDIRWKSAIAAEYCLNDSAASAPLRCWAMALSGTHSQQREVSEAFVYWLGAPGGAQRVAEVKIEVLRLDSDRPASRAAHAACLGRPMTASNIDILLIEDDARLAELTATYLGQNGLRVAVEARGDRALERFAQERPRLVLLDLLLPGKDGLAICRELRRTHDVPILILTARDTDFDHVIGLESGADDYVMKPVDPMVLLARVRALLRRAERGDAAGDRRAGPASRRAAHQRDFARGVAAGPGRCRSPPRNSSC